MKLKREAFGKCIAEVAAQAGTSEDQAFGIIQTVADYGERLRKAGQENPFQKAAEGLSEQRKIEALQARSDTLRNAIIRNRILSRVDARGFENADTTLRGLLRFDPRAQTNTSIESKYHALDHSWSSSVASQLQRKGLDKVAIQGGLDKEISEVIWRLNNGEPDTSVKVSPEAQKIGEIYHQALDLVRARLNNAGAHIGDGVGHITETQWDARALQKAAGTGSTREEAFEAWRSKEEPRMAPKTFEHLTPEEGETDEEAKTRFLRSLYEATSTGVHKTYRGLVDDGAGYVSPNYQGTFNVARAASKKRVVYWNSSKDWYDHMQEFGGGDSLLNQVQRTISQGARNVSLMEGLGTNPEGNFNSIVQKLQEKYRAHPNAADFDKAVDGNFVSPGLKTELGYLTGSNNIPKNAFWADTINAAITLEAESKLGGVAVPHILSSPMTVSSELTKHGISRVNSFGDLLKAFTQFRSPEERAEIFNQAGAYTHGWRLQLNKITPRSGIPGYLSWFANNFLKLTGLPTMLDRFQSESVKASLMNNLADNTDKEFSGLHPDLQRTLKKYEIGPEEWDLLRNSSSGVVKDSSGLNYLTARAPDEIPRDQLKTLLESKRLLKPDADEATADKRIQQFRWHLSDRYLMYLNDAAERATVTPGIREQALLLRGLQPGTPEWTAAKAFAQFKAWPLAALNQIVQKEFSWSMSKTGLASNIGWLLGLSTLAGALRMSVVDAVNGRPAKDFTQPHNLLTALGQGGGIGIFGDFLFGEVNRGRDSSLSEFFGPLGEDAEAIYKSYKEFTQELNSSDTIGDSASKAFRNLAADTVHGLTTHIPYSNLVYLKGALDYLAFYHMYEAVSPGWWERTNKRMEAETGHYMAGYQPGQGVPWGIPTPIPGQPLLSQGQ